MFTLARQIVRHKVGVAAVGAFAIVMFAGDRNDREPAKPSSPWAANAPAEVAEARKAEDDTATARLGKAAVAVGEVAAEQLLGEKERNPVKMGGEAVENFKSANDAFAEANGGN
jgi:hypothetical protein